MTTAMTEMVRFSLNSISIRKVKGMSQSLRRRIDFVECTLVRHIRKRYLGESVLQRLDRLNQTEARKTPVHKLNLGLSMNPSRWSWAVGGALHACGLPCVDCPLHRWPAINNRYPTAPQKILRSHVEVYANRPSARGVTQ